MDRDALSDRPGGDVAQALRESEARFHALFTASPVPFMVLTPNAPDFTIQAANEAYFAATKTTPETLIGRRLFDVFTDDPSRPGQLGSEVLAISLDRVLASKRKDEMARVRYDLVTPDGFEPHWWEAINAPMLNAAGEVTAIIHQVHRVTELQRAEEAERDGLERQAFLLRLSDALRAEPGVDAVAERAIGMLRDHLRLDRCYISMYRVAEDRADFPYQVGNDKVPPLPDTVRLADFPDAFKQVLGETFVFEDNVERRGLSEAEVRNTRNLGVCAMIASTIRHGENNPLSSLAAVSGEPRRWTRGEIALVEETAERTWAAMERARAEAALRESEARYRTLFETIDEGFTLMEALRDDVGRVVDVTYREANAAWERQAGVERPVGRRASAIFGEVGQAWIDNWTKVLDTGEAVRDENHIAGSDRWFNVHYSRVGGPGSELIAAVFDDVTARKRAERALRENGERQAFLLKLSDVIQRLRRANDIKAAAACLLGEHLSVARAQYHEVDDSGACYSADGIGYANGLPLLDLNYRIDDFGAFVGRDFAAGRPFRSDDLLVDPRVSAEERDAYAFYKIRSGAGVSLIRDDKLVAILALHDVRPRRWTDADFELIRETAERIWIAVERARAEATLQQEQKRQAFLLKLSDAIRPLAEPIEIQTVALRLLAEHMDLSRAAYSEIQEDHDRARRVATYDRNLPPLPRDVRISDFSADQLACYVEGRSFVVSDTEADERVAATREVCRAIQVRAWVGVPIVKRGRLLTVLGVEKMTPHAWTDAEVELVREVTERTWAASERGHIEGALRTSETRFREFGENSSDALWILDAETRQLEYLSPAFERIWGIGRDEVMADLSRWADLAHPDDRAGASEALPRLLAGEPFQADYRIIRPDGEVRWIRDAGFPIAEGGVVKRGGGIAQDVTELKRAEAAVRESETRLRGFGEASQDILWIRDAATLQWQYLTPAFEAIYGQSREEALAGNNYRGWVELILPEDRAHAMENIRRVRAGEQVAFEYRIRRPVDGAVRWLRNTDFPIRDEAGDITLIGGIGHDMTELREAEQRFRVLVEGIPQLVWRSCDKGLWTWASPQWLAFTGQTQAESHGRGWLDAIHPDDRPATMRAWEEARPHGRLDTEYRVRRATDGAWIWHRTRSVPVRDEAGRITEWLGTSTDVHALRVLQDRQEVMVKELQHRTRNLITVVGALSKQTMKNARSLGDFEQRFGHRLSALSRVQGLLSHLSAGKRVAFDELLRSELSALGAPDGKMTLDGPADVPLRSATVQTFALALHELATNALKYGALAAPDGRLAVRWSVSRPNGDAPRLLVDWRESGVTIIQDNERVQGGGYGRELIERALPYQLDADTTYEMTGDGVHCTIAVPIPATEAGDRPLAPNAA